MLNDYWKDLATDGLLEKFDSMLAQFYPASRVSFDLLAG